MKPVSMKALILFFVMAFPPCAFTAQDYSAEIQKMFADKEDTDIVYKDALSEKREGHYYISRHTLHVKYVSWTGVVVNFKDIDFSAPKIKKEVSVFSLALEYFDRDKDHEPGSEPAKSTLYLYFPEKDMAEQALVYLKQYAETVKIITGGGTSADVPASSAEVKEAPAAAAAPAVLPSSAESAAGAVYKEVIIGKQTWMAANLEVAVFANGEAIPEANTKAAWDKATKEKTPAWSYYGNDPANGEKYGKLYNWYAVHDPRGLAPKGWHVPTKEEFEKLIGMSFTNGKELKSDNDWEKSGNGDNGRGFDGRPGGYYSDGVSRYMHSEGNWWSSSADDIASYAKNLVLKHNIDLAMVLSMPKDLGMSVRCIKDQEAAQATDILSGGGAAKAVPAPPAVRKSGEAYKEVKIGRQIWMAKNLDVAVFANGEAIPEANTAAAWKKASEEKTPAWCYYAHDPANSEQYGKLYNWYAVNDGRSLAPKGWHIPTEAEFDLLKMRRGPADAKRLKSVYGWTESEELDEDDEPTGKVYGDGDNSSGFDGRPGGVCLESLGFSDLRKSGNWWSSSRKSDTSAFYLVLKNYNDIAIVPFKEQATGMSVRCVKD